MREERRQGGKGVKLAGNRVGRPKNHKNRLKPGFGRLGGQKTTAGLPAQTAGLAVRAIEEGIFADGCRQSFADGRGQALPFFHRRVICQYDGKNQFTWLNREPSADSRRLFSIRLIVSTYQSWPAITVFISSSHIFNASAVFG